MQNKTIILSSMQNTNNQSRGILTLTSDEHLKGKLRLYNVNAIPPDTKFAIYYNEKVYSTELKKISDYYVFDIFEEIDISNQFYCALMQQNNGKSEAFLAGGTYDGMVFSNIDLANAKDKTDPKTESYIDECISKEFENDLNQCSDCTYKKDFYDSKYKTVKPEFEQKEQLNKSLNQQLNSNENIRTGNNNQSEFRQKYYENKQAIKKLEENDNETPQNNPSSEDENLTARPGDFLSSVAEQIDELFATYPPEEQIIRIIPNSKFIKITDSQDDSSYIIGVIYENDEIKYLVYGVPLTYNATPPIEMGSNFQWLPLDPDDPMSDGYFLIYQNASDGKIVEVKVS